MVENRYESGSEDGEIREIKNNDASNKRRKINLEPCSRIHRNSKNFDLSKDRNFQNSLNELVQWGIDFAQNLSDKKFLKEKTTGLSGEKLLVFYKYVLLETKRLKDFYN